MASSSSLSPANSGLSQSLAEVAARLSDEALVSAKEELETPLTEEEQAEVQELVDMGIPQDDARECYMLAEKNKMMAADIFFSRN